MIWHSRADDSQMSLGGIPTQSPEVSESLSYWASRALGYAALAVVTATGLGKLFFF